MGADENNGNYANKIREPYANAVLGGMEAILYSKEKGVDELKAYEGIITCVKIGQFVEFTDKNGEQAHVPFCTAYSGLYRIVDKKLWRLAFENPHVLSAYRARVGTPHMISDEEGRLALALMGEFFLYFNTWSGTPNVRF
jgi:hypothetical protein